MKDKIFQIKLSHLIIGGILLLLIIFLLKCNVNPPKINTYDKEKAALKQFLEKPEIAKYIKKKTVDKVNPYTISSIEDDIK